MLFANWRTKDKKASKTDEEGFLCIRDYTGTFIYLFIYSFLTRDEWSVVSRKT